MMSLRMRSSHGDVILIDFFAWSEFYSYSHSAQESFSNHCGSHGSARKVKQFSLALACKEQLVNWETLKRNDFTARVEKCFETLRTLKDLLGTPCSCSLGDPSMRVIIVPESIESLLNGIFATIQFFEALLDGLMIVFPNSLNQFPRCAIDVLEDYNGRSVIYSSMGS